MALVFYQHLSTFSIDSWLGNFLIYFRKVQAFSKFLYNENIKNLLSKEKKWFKDYTETKDYPGYYPYERALQFYKEVKKLGKF